MGYELWVSQTTGYRRRGTRLIDLHRELGAIVVRSLYEPLLSCPAEAPSEEMRQELQRRDFDVAGVRRERESPVIGYVERSTLVGGTVQDHLRRFESDDLVEDLADLRTVLVRLRHRSATFVTVGGQVEGILTHADLNKPIARMLLFALISLLEMHMAFWIRTEFPNGEWQFALSEGRLEKARELNGKRPELDLFDCLQYADRRDLFIKIDWIRKDLSLGTGKKDAAAKLKRTEILRNDLAHSQYYLARHDQWSDVIDLVQWVDRLLSASDTLIEERAGSIAEGYVNRLW